MNTIESECKFRFRLNEIVAERDLPNYEIEDAIEVGRGTLNRLTTGKSMPSYRVIVKLCKFFDVSADWLMGLSDYETRKRA